MDKITNSLLWRWIVVPFFRFWFEFVGDRPWLLAVIVGLIAILIWRFLWPWVRGFHALFGWRGWGLLAVALLTFGAFGAGWRAHRDTFSDVREHPIDEDDPRRPKPKPKPRDDQNTDPLFPGGDDFLKKIFKRSE